MKKFYSLLGVLAFVLFAINANSQARLTYDVTPSAPKIVMNGGVYLVVENPNANALHPNAAPNPIIVSEDETNVIKWYKNPATGPAFRLPFSSPEGNNVTATIAYDLPADLGVQGADAHFIFASYGTDNTNLPAPSDVNHITTLAVDPVGTTNENNTVDRYWIIDAVNYTTKPNMRLWLIQEPTEIAAPNLNMVSPGSYMIQRFNPGAGVNGQWADYLPGAVTMSGANVVGPTKFPGTEMYRSWTVTNFSSPLSVDILGFGAECDTERVLIEWSTASETNSDFFTVQKSEDAQNWETIEILSSVGNSNEIVNYEAYDLNPKNGVNYYQLIETDVNGVESKFGPISTSCGSDVFEIVNVINNYGSNQEFDVVINSSDDKVFDLRVIDITGKLIYENFNMSVSQGISNVQVQKGDLGMGVYFVTIQTPTELLTKKVILN